MFIKHRSPVLGDGDMAVKMQTRFLLSWWANIKTSKMGSKMLKCLGCYKNRVVRYGWGLVAWVVRKALPELAKFKCHLNDQNQPAKMGTHIPGDFSSECLELCPHKHGEWRGRLRAGV